MLKKIINTCLLVCLGLCFSFSVKTSDFKSQQMAFSRVKTAYAGKWAGLKSLLRSKGLEENSFRLYLRVFKEESILEVWVLDAKHSTWQLLKTNTICAKSGNPGPKRKQGDGQVPEGFYNIAAFNPSSSYHLSLKVNYPNKSDRLKAKGDPGGDIMLHGECVTIGCIPIQNGPIEELYVLCTEAKNRGLEIPVDIYPYRFGKDGDHPNENDYNADTQLVWKSLKKAHSYFELNHILPKIAIDAKGNYSVSGAKTP